MELIIFFVIIFTFTRKISSQATLKYSDCGPGTYAPNSTYQSNLNQALSTFSSDTQITYGFYNISTGKPPNRVEATALCMGDLLLPACRSVIQQIIPQIKAACPHQKQAFGYSETCVIFYSNVSIFRQLLLDQGYLLMNSSDLSTVPRVNRTLFSFMEKLKTKATSGNSKLKFASDKVNIAKDRTNQSIAPGSAPSSSTNIVPTTPEGSEKTKKGGDFIIITIIGSLVFIFIGLFILKDIIILFALMSWSNKKRRKQDTKFDKEDIETLESLQFSLATIKVATDFFSDGRKLGQGGFGTVYKGTLPDGQQIAVKRLSTDSGQGDIQFKNEILILTKVLHRNLVRLLGFCLEGKERILIYEFVTNKSLDAFLVDPLKRASLPWETRYKLINGIAKGVHYLHEDSRLKIIHRDLKAANVLLDDEFNPKVADFGMARLFNIDQTRTITEQVVGTYGYMPPEYLRYGQVSTKLDVFSFGVVVLEIISGCTISTFGSEDNPESLLTFAWKNWQHGTPLNLVDPILSNISRPEIMICIHIGLLCVQKNQAERPLISSVTLMLNRTSNSLQAPSQPAFFIQEDGVFSINEVSVTMPSGR